MSRLNWAALVRRINGHRAGSALFFKPVCVIAAIDLADEGRITPDNIDMNAVLDRFSDYITPFFADRGGKHGLQPLWRLTNDHLWTFFDGEKVVKAKAFPRGAPATKAELFDKTDRLAINEDLIALWSSARERRALRDSMLLMLHNSDAKSRQLIAPLFDPQHLQERTLWPSDSVLETYFKNLRDQPGLFDEDISRDGLKNDRSPKSSHDAVPNLLASLPPTPDAVENVPTPIDYVWLEGRISVGPNSANVPIFPNVLAAHDHTQRLEACTVGAQDLIRDLGRRRWQVREDYEIWIRRYLERLPTEVDSGNILLADAIVRTLREMFFADQNDLPPAFASSLKIMLQQHIGLRPFYPQIGDFYRSVKTGRIDDPLPLDAVGDVIGVVRAQTPTVFDVSVSNAISEASSPEPQVTVVKHDISEDGAILPPPDPLGELDPNKARDFQTAGWINSLWKVFKAGSIIHATTDAWIATYRSLNEPIKQILVWLNQFLDR